MAIGKKRNAGICLLCCCLIAALFTGCGNSSPEEASDQVYYHIQETAIPDPDEELVDVFGNAENTIIWEMDMVQRDGIFYRIALCREMNGYIDLLQEKYFIQILEPPYQKWVTYEIGTIYEDGLYRAPQHVLDIEDGQLLFFARNSLVQWQPGMEVPEKVSDNEYDNSARYGDLWGWKMYRTDEGTLYIYDLSGNTVTVLDGTLKERETKDLGAETIIYGMTEEPGNGELLWYGTQNREFGVWRLEDGAAVLPEDAAIGSSSMQLHRGSGEDGGLYLADCQGLWRMEEGAVTELCRFSDRSYTLQELYSMEVMEDGSLLLFVKCYEEDMLLRIEGNRVPFPEKQVITLATTYTGKSSLDRAISRFNRTNEQYQVELLMPDVTREIAPDYIAKLQEFLDRIMMETAAGKGPDLFFSHLINMSDMVQNGYLQSLEGVLEDEDAYWQAALDSGRLQGELYGIPYDCLALTLTTYSGSFAGDRQSWTLPELMDAVRSSDAEVLQNNSSGWAIVLYYGLCDNDNKTFIDWENGKSHLTEEPFLDLLEFAREYADNDQHTWEKDAEAVREGKMVAVNLTIGGGSGFDDLSRLENIFSGEPAHLGYPRSEGNGIYVEPRLFFLNAQSDKREGAEVFLRYLLSEETQMRLAVFSVDDFPPVVGEASAEMPNLAVRLSALEKSIELGLEKGPKSLAYNLFHDGLTEEQAQWLRFFIENAHPGNFYVKEIEDIIYEELEPYFQGQRTAEEAARILDNRVQLYLDERK